MQQPNRHTPRWGTTSRTKLEKDSGDKATMVLPSPTYTGNPMEEETRWNQHTNGTNCLPCSSWTGNDELATVNNKKKR